MDAAEEPVASIAAANPGVLVNAPAIKPAISSVGMPKAYMSPMPVRQADTTIKRVTRIKVFPLLRKESKKPGPAWIPIVKIKSTSPKLPNSLGITTPKCPKSKAMKITAETSSEMPRILIFPNTKPNATIRNKAK